MAISAIGMIETKGFVAALAAAEGRERDHHRPSGSW